jgi:acetoin utilization protein AcuB
MDIARWMTRRVEAVKPLDSIVHARAVMEQHRINQLPVVVDGRLAGIITDRDVRDAFPSVFESASDRRRKRGPHSEGDPREIRVEAVMTPNVLTLAPTDSMQAAARLMRRERLGSVPVVEHGRLVGLLTRSDVLDAFLALSEEEDDVVRSDFPRRKPVSHP